MITFEDSAEPVTRLLKIMVYGGAGVGKTMFCLSAPGLLVFDSESSTDPYRGRKDIAPFTVAKTASAKEIAPVLDQLQNNGFIQAGAKRIEPQTLAIDSFSVLWAVSQEAGQKRAERRAVNKKQSAEDARLAFGDWSLIKRPIQQLSTRLINMPVHVIITAREKALFDDEKDQPKQIGTVPDIEKNIPYVFDLVLRLVVENGKRFAIVEKSRFLDFPPGKRIENPSWKTFEYLASAGNSASAIPDTEAAAEEEAKEPPQIKPIVHEASEPEPPADLGDFPGPIETPDFVISSMNFQTLVTEVIGLYPDLAGNRVHASNRILAAIGAADFKALYTANVTHNFILDKLTTYTEAK